MKQRIAYLVLFCVVILIAVAFIRYGLLAGTVAQASDTTTQTLISEMRELRRALQDLAVNSSRMQIAVEKWRVQQSIADRASLELQAVQDQLDGENSNLRQLEQTVKQLQEQINAEPNQLQKAALSRELQSMQANAEEVRQRTQRLQQREAEARSNMNAEKAKAQEARDALDALDPARKK